MRGPFAIGAAALFALGACAIAQDQPAPIAVFTAGAGELEGVAGAAPRYAQYREPNAVLTREGTLVLVCQARNKSRWSDRSGQDLVVKRSADGGRTWSRAALVASHGKYSICPNAAIYDRERGVIFVLYNLFLWDYTRRPEEVRGELGDLNCKQYLVSSADQGASWSAPREISEMIATHGAVAVFGSGEGIQLRRGPHAGRLIVAGGDFYRGKKVLCFFSDDHGATWKRSALVPHEGKMAWASESKLAELADGTLVLNSRTFVRAGGGGRRRTRAFSRDGGQSWSRLENDPALAAVSCNGSLLALPAAGEKRGTVLLCSVPAGPGRTHGTVYISFDGGRTWPRRKLVVAGFFAYSSLVQLPGGAIGLFYEARQHKDIELLRCPRKWLLQGDPR